MEQMLLSSSTGLADQLEKRELSRFAVEFVETRDQLRRLKGLVRCRI